MYPKVAAGAASLPFTGLLFGWKVVAATSLILAGATIVRLLPRRRTA